MDRAGSNRVSEHRISVIPRVGPCARQPKELTARVGAGNRVIGGVFDPGAEITRRGIYVPMTRRPSVRGLPDRPSFKVVEELDPVGAAADKRRLRRSGSGTKPNPLLLLLRVTFSR